MHQLLLVLVLVGAACGVAEPVRFDGHSVLRLLVDEKNPSHVEIATVALLHKMELEWGLDFWSEVDFRVPPAHKESVISFLAQRKIAWETFIEDVQEHIDQAHVHTAKVAALEASRTVDIFHSGNSTVPAFFNDYRKLDDIYAFMDSLVQQYPGLAQKVVIGTSYENRTIYGLVIKSNKSPQDGIYLEAGIHSREWVSHSTVSFIAWSLLSGYGADATLTQLVDRFTWHLVPALNVDGYVFTWTGNRMWRKTRTPNVGSSCIGTDPNRNWDNHWCQQGADKNPCSDSYCGPKAFSEAEPRAAANYIKGKNMRSVIDFHSYSQLWMKPYGWTRALPKDDKAQHVRLSGHDQHGLVWGHERFIVKSVYVTLFLQEAGLAAVAAIKAKHGLTYKEGSIYTVIYPASGSSADWAYDSAGVTYPYGVELRDTGRYGFLLPADQIVPCGEEILAAVSAMAQYIASH